jgi:Flp pilus assembly protein TadD
MTDELTDQIIAKTEELTEEKKGAEAVAEASDLSEINQKDAIIWFVTGKAHYVNNEFDEALSCFSKAAQIEKENPQVWHMMGYALISLNRLGESEQALEYVKALQPSNAEAICALGICQVMQNKPDIARKNFDEAIKANKPVSFQMLEHFQEKFFATSKDTASGTKAMIERVLETMKLTR